MEDVKSKIKEALKFLSYREREIIKLMYGIDDGYSYTRNEVSQIFKVCAQRIDQIHDKAIRKLKNNIECLQLLHDALELSLENNEEELLPHRLVPTEYLCPEKEDIKNYYTKKEVADFCRVSVATIAIWLRKSKNKEIGKIGGNFPLPVKITGKGGGKGGMYLWEKSDIHKFIGKSNRCQLTD